MSLTAEELERYRRHLALPRFGQEAQQRLKEASVVVIGAGGLGSPAALYLAAAGVGTIGLVDHDRVDVTNLQRQILHGTGDVGRLKTESAEERLRDLNPLVQIQLHPQLLTSSNALEVLAGYDVVVDGSDNFPTRYLVSDAAVLLGKPYVYGSVFRFEGQASVFDATRGPCYRCLYPEPPPPGLVPSCEEGGVLGVLPGVIGAIQATEAIKILTGIGRSLVGRLLLFDALSAEFREIALKKDPACRLCGKGSTISQLVDYKGFCGMSEGIDIEPAELRERLSAGPVRLIDVREPYEWKLGHIEGAELIPLSTLPSNTDHLDREEEIIVYCHMGGRSARAVAFLREAGFRNVRNLVGGYGRWAGES